MKIIASRFGFSTPTPEHGKYLKITVNYSDSFSKLVLV